MQPILSPSRPRLLCAVLALSLGAAAAPAAAQVACTSLNTVQISALAPMNNQYGGHLNAHIYGQTPPQGFTQDGRTLFRDDDDWAEAYAELVNMNPPLYCAQNPQPNAEAARDVPVQFFSLRCTAADAQGRCTAYTEIQTNTVRVVMRYLGNRWVVYTAYPVPN